MSIESKVVALENAREAVIRAAQNWCAYGMSARLAGLALETAKANASPSFQGMIDIFTAYELRHKAEANNMRGELELLEALEALNKLGAK